MDFKIPNGARVKDSVTGFSGIVTGRADYLTGCRQYCVTPKAKGGAVADGRWYDEQRLLVLDSKAVQINNETIKGGPQDSPPAR
jgi:hypothetical protein